MTMQEDKNAVQWYIQYINGFTNSGMYFYTDEINYGQLRYNAMLAAAEVLGGVDVVAAALARIIPADKLLGLDPMEEADYTPLWRLVQRHELCHYSDMPQYEAAFDCQLPAWRENDPWNDEELAEFKKVGAWDTFCSELCMLNAVLRAASEHC